jgi:hypothetical protein
MAGAGVARRAPGLNSIVVPPFVNRERVGQPLRWQCQSRYTFHRRILFTSVMIHAEVRSLTRLWCVRDDIAKY